MNKVFYMYISLITNLSGKNNKQNTVLNSSVSLSRVGYSCSLTGPAYDTVSFTSKLKKAEKKKLSQLEENFKELDNVHDPYSDVVMISKTRFKVLQAKLRGCSSSEDMLGILGAYKKHMFADGEAKVYDMLILETERLKSTKKYRNREITFKDIIKEEYPAAKTRYKYEQLSVLDNIQFYAEENLDKNEQKTVNNKLKIIEKNINEDTFKIRAAKSILNELYKELPDKNKVKNIIDMTDDFPSVANSVDAFIVKNIDSTSQEIAEALVSPASISIEHIRPQTSGGESKGGNYIAASRRMNNYRGSMSYSEFVEKFPKIPSQTQRYYDELVQKANRGEIPDIAFTLPDSKEALFKESKGLINVNLNFNKTVYDKISGMKEKFDELIDYFLPKK